MSCFDGEIEDGMEHFRPMHSCYLCGDDCDCLYGQEGGSGCEGCIECHDEPPLKGQT